MIQTLLIKALAIIPCFKSIVKDNVFCLFIPHSWRNEKATSVEDLAKSSKSLSQRCNLGFYWWQFLYSLKHILILISTLKWFRISVRPIILFVKKSKSGLRLVFLLWCDTVQRANPLLNSCWAAKKHFQGKMNIWSTAGTLLNERRKNKEKNKRLHQSVKWDHWKSRVNDQQTNNNREIKIVVNPPPVQKKLLEPEIQSFRDALTSP